MNHIIQLAASKKENSKMYIKLESGGWKMWKVKPEDGYSLFFSFIISIFVL